MEKTTLYIDIETIPSEEAPAFKGLVPPKTYKKPESIERWKVEAQAAAWKKQALESTQGFIVCIGLAKDEEDAQVFTSVAQFRDFVIQAKEEHLLINFVAHNIEFDRLFLFHAALKNNMPDLAAILSGKFGDTFTCTMDLFAPFVWKYRISLKKLATFLEVPQHKEDCDGGKVWDMFKEGKLQDIYNYCKKDVELTRNCYYKLLY